MLPVITDSGEIVEVGKNIVIFRVLLSVLSTDFVQNDIVERIIELNENEETGAGIKMTARSRSVEELSTAIEENEEHPNPGGGHSICVANCVF